MARKFFYGEVLPSTPAFTTKLGAQNANYKDTEVGKLVKVGPVDSAHQLCAVGDLFAGYITSISPATADGFTIGGIQRCDSRFVTADGTQAAGTGVLALGDFVVAGTPVAQNTGLGVTLPKVRKATLQPVDAGFIAGFPYFWQVTSLGVAGTGAVGTKVLIERVAGNNR